VTLGPRDRLIVALDVPTADEALALADRLAGSVGMFKVGSQLFTAAGPRLVEDLVRRGEKVFLDLKYHDIPNTVSSAARVAGGLGVSLLTVHALGGSAMVSAAVEAVAGTATRVLAITVLTSHAPGSLQELGITGALPDVVRRWALVAHGARAHGVVASPEEIPLLRQACGTGFLIVTPGIRPASAEAGDQARVATPRAAVHAGADYIVVGRPILRASDPARAAADIVQSYA
jgi:orotidine-5'-phosphate decarboxylase